MWACPKCEEEVDDDLDVCWACGTSIDGEEDPDFLTADEAGPLVDVAEDGIPDLYGDEGGDFGETLPDLADVFAARDAIEARFVANQLRLAGIPALSGRVALKGTVLGSSIWGGGPHVRVRPQDLDRARAWVLDYQERRKARDAKGDRDDREPD